jgi:hypothetical protein
LTAKRIEGPSGMSGRPFSISVHMGSSIAMRQTLCLLLLLAACNREEQPQAPTQAESDRLNDAETMLNGLANEEGPEAEAPDPSNQSAE